MVKQAANGILTEDVTLIRHDTTLYRGPRKQNKEYVIILY